MKKTFLLLSAVMLSMILFSGCEKKPEQVSLFFKEVIYNFYDNVDYYTANLLTCYGVRDLKNPSVGTIYASISIKANINCLLKLSSTDGRIDDTYITEYMVYPLEYYTSKPFNYEVSMVKDQVTVLNLEFPNVPSNLVKVGRLGVAVVINNFRYYGFTIHQIPYKPSTDLIVWN